MTSITSPLSRVLLSSWRITRRLLERRLERQSLVLQHMRLPCNHSRLETHLTRLVSLFALQAPVFALQAPLCFAGSCLCKHKALQAPVQVSGVSRLTSDLEAHKSEAHKSHASVSCCKQVTCHTSRMSRALNLKAPSSEWIGR